MERGVYMETWVRFWKQYDKRRNSTATPREPISGLRHEEFPIMGTLIDETDVLQPVITFLFTADNPNTPDIMSIVSVLNYAYIDDFRRYYFVSDWTYYQGRWTAHFTVDVLATYKGAFTLEPPMYILRCADKFNRLIPDAIYPFTAEDATERVELVTTSGGLWKSATDISSGFYVCGIVNSESSSYGSVTYYVFTPSQLRSLIDKLMGDFSWLNFNDVSEELGKALINPFQYIVSCMWFPVAPQYHTVSTVKYGWWSFAIGGGVVDKACQESWNSGKLYIPSHPKDGGNYNTFYNMPPFRSITVCAEPFGMFELVPPYECKTVEFFVNIDFITGKSVLECRRSLSITSEGETVWDVIAYREGVVGVPVQLSQMTTNVLGVAESAISAVGGAFDNLIKGQIGGAIANVASGIVSAAEESIPSMSTKGTNGSYLSYYIKPFAIVKYRLQAEECNEIFGRPLCEYDYIDAHRGYLQVASPNVKLTGATSREKDMVNQLLASGIYYE